MHSQKGGYDAKSHTNIKLRHAHLEDTLTIRVWCLTECEKIYYGIVHLQHSRTLPMHYCQTRPPAHSVIGQATRQDYEGIPGTHTYT